MVKRKINFGHLGNGFLVWDSLQEKNGDYVKVAHINTDRTIDYYENLGSRDLIEIEHFAVFNDGNISSSQDAKVFLDRPIQQFDTNKYTVVVEYYNCGRIFTGVTIDRDEVTDGFKTYVEAAKALLEVS